MENLENPAMLVELIRNLIDERTVIKQKVKMYLLKNQIIKGDIRKYKNMLIEKTIGIGRDSDSDFGCGCDSDCDH